VRYAELADAKAAVELFGSKCSRTKEYGMLKLSDECDVDSNGSKYRYSAAALRAHHLYDAAIDTALLDESLEAIGMVESLGKFVGVEKRRLDERQDGVVGP